MVRAGQLEDFFACPECDGYLRDPHVAMCCLKTYCRDCLVRVLHRPASQCPNCRKYLGVSLPTRTRPDPQLQAVMQQLLPGVMGA